LNHRKKTESDECLTSKVQASMEPTVSTKVV